MTDHDFRMKWTKECGERLRTTRKAAGLSQDHLARKVGMNCSAVKVSRWERCSGGAPNQADVTALCAALDVTAPYLLCQTDDPKGYAGRPPEPGIDYVDVWQAEKRAEQDAEAAAKVDAYVRQERRDKFARAALTGILANCYQTANIQALIDDKVGAHIVRDAWGMADAMLRADE